MYVSNNGSVVILCPVKVFVTNDLVVKYNKGLILIKNVVYKRLTCIPQISFHLITKFKYNFEYCKFYFSCLL